MVNTNEQPAGSEQDANSRKVSVRIVRLLGHDYAGAQVKGVRRSLVRIAPERFRLEVARCERGDGDQMRMRRGAEYVRERIGKPLGVGGLPQRQLLPQFRLETKLESVQILC